MLLKMVRRASATKPIEMEVIVVVIAVATILNCNCVLPLMAELMHTKCMDGSA